MGRRRSGIALVVVSGLAVLLGLQVCILLAGARLQAAATRSDGERMRGRLAALSGMDYAVARLVRGAWPLHASDPVRRGDDWASKDGPLEPLGRVANPSYGHGEPWNDSDGDGQYTAADGPQVADLDGNGMFSAWSGRLRGKTDAFVLRIESAGGKIPLNAGTLSAPEHNLLGSNQWYHRGIANALNSLGAIVLDPGPGVPERGEVPTSGDPVPFSRLGIHLIEGRPAGGYRSREQVRDTLLARGYAPAACGRIIPFLDIGPCEPLSEGGIPQGVSPFVAPAYAPVELATAPEEVLAALWTHVGRQYAGGLPAEPGAWLRSYPRCPGLAYLNAGPGQGTSALMLFRDEAEGIAKVVHDFRRDGAELSWTGLYERILMARETVFVRDLSGLPSADFPSARRAWAAEKTRLALSVALPGRLGTTPSIQGSWGIDHDAGAPGIQPATVRQVMPQLCAILAPVPQAGGGWNWPPPGGNAPYLFGGDLLSSPGMTLARPVRFDIESLGRPGAGRSGGIPVSGTIALAERLEFFTQADFENLSGERLASRGIAVDPWETAGEAAAHRPARAESVPPADPGGTAASRAYPQVASGPFWNPRSGAWNPGVAKLQCRTAGFLALTGREGGAQGAVRYWPFREDFDGEYGNDFTSEPDGLQIHADETVSGPWRLAAPVPSTGIPVPWLLAPESGGDGEVIDRCSIEAWVSIPAWGTDSARKVFEVKPWHAPTPPPPPFNTAFFSVSWNRILQEAGPPSGAGPVPGVLFELKAKWVIRDEEGEEWCWPVPVSLTTFRPDVDPADPGSVRTGHYHVVATVKRVMTPGPPALTRTRFRLYVDGLFREEGYLPSGESYPLLSSGSEKLAVSDADEIRLYGEAIDVREETDAEGNAVEIPTPERISQRYQLGRFVRPPQGPGNPGLNPVYRSARYEPGAGTRLLEAQWNGWTSPGMAAEVRMRLRMAGAFDDAGGAVGPAVVLDDSGRRCGLEPLGASSFQYELEFFDPDPGTPPSGPLLDTPSFDSVWIAFRRRSPSWSAYRVSN